MQYIQMNSDTSRKSNVQPHIQMTAGDTNYNCNCDCDKLIMRVLGALIDFNAIYVHSPFSGCSNSHLHSYWIMFYSIHVNRQIQKKNLNRINWFVIVLIKFNVNVLTRHSFWAMIKNVTHHVFDRIKQHYYDLY